MQTRSFLMMRLVLRSWLWLSLLGLFGGMAQACSGSETGGSLGSVSSQRVSSGTSVTGSGIFNFNCSATVLTVLGTPSLTGTLQASVTGLTLKNTGNSAITIPYQIYSNGGNTISYGSAAVVVSLNGATLLSVLNSSGASGTVPIYIGTTPGAVVPAGTYTDTIQVTWTYANICEGLIGVAGVCVGVANNGTVTRSLLVTLTVTNDCTITAPVVNFGSAPLVGGFSTISQNISLTCSKSMSYTVGMSNGANVGSNGRRRMASGAQRLEYDIFKADSTVWGSSGTARANGPAAADGVSQQSIPYTARVYTDQTTPSVGSYTDNVVVDVSF